MENIELVLPLGGTIMMDEDAASIVAQIRNLLGQLRIKGITDKEIDTILTQQQKPGRAYINSRGMLVLPDENGVQIKLTPMERTLYILFLRYPEGINADELWRYWDELCRIYGSQMIYDDRSLIEDAVEGICDEEKVTWYTNVSRIKRKITDKLACLTVHCKGIFLGVPGGVENPHGIKSICIRAVCYINLRKPRNYR